MTATLAGSLIGLAISNIVVAAPIALFAWWIQVRGNRPFLSHLLWLLVLVKLVTPPFFSLPVVFAPVGWPAAIAAVDPSNLGTASAAGPSGTWYDALTWPLALVGVWLIGSAVALAGALIRAHRFDRLLRQTSNPSEAKLQTAAAEIASLLGVTRIPEVFTTRARISPLVWWIGGAVRIYLPRAIVERMTSTELGSILTHELGHVRRGDHYVRWLECAVSVLLWWNPLAWWARRNLRVCEEICCDAFVLSKTDSSRAAYADALVSAMELLATPALRPAGLASHVNGGFIERRIRMILSGQSIPETPRWLRATVVAAAALVLPLGFSSAQDAGDLDRVQEWLDSGVNSAFLTEKQAEIMMRALKDSTGGLEFKFIDEQGNVVMMRSEVRIDGDNVVRNPEASQVELDEALVVAEKFFRTRAENGQMTPEQAEAAIEDVRSAAAGRPIAGAAVEKQFELEWTADRLALETSPDRKVKILRADNVVITRPDETE